ncbi:hypothetical protein [Flavobacterium sp.]|jgi:hypothetical protein|uniref:hypothetical protein n=1 Tax=Flavobacterium sp. TaxID=239 RepID=UPI0037C118F9
MQKILAFLNKYAFHLNLIIILFWLYIIYENYQHIQQNDSFEERKFYFVVPVLFILLSVFNMYMANKRRKQN